MTTRARFDLEIFSRILKNGHSVKLHFTFFSLENLTWFYLLKEV